ncbi:MerR family transcriptional regulator [Ktedonobacter robiniae]|uniref:MerR family transcriptional regulator n=1 Tax=Ktedonobacter robiniae TaxID=2778365 RepID=A0ABQ3UW87_9CHLR|nr:MerR family transcriptional regulator [Ktedonobacter robiniae]GHO56947.1 MerR family transcriptional regulator [Ktedonobacter robiniae]
MRIGELSRLTGASMRSLRHYESRGLIKAARLENGYRDYDESVIEQIRAIQLYLGLGLNTDEIGRLFTCESLGKRRDVDVKPGECGKNVLNLYTKKIQAIDAEMQALANIKSRLMVRVNLIQGEIATIVES